MPTRAAAYLAVAAAGGSVAGIVGVLWGGVAAIALVAAMAALAACVLWREAPLFLFLGLVYTRLSDVLVARFGGPSLLELVIALLVAWLVLKAVRSCPPSGMGRPAMVLAAVGAMHLLTLSFFAIDRGAAAANAINFAENAVIVLILVALVQTLASLSAITWALIGSVGLLGTLTLAQTALGLDSAFWGLATRDVEHLVAGVQGARAGGPLGSANFFAQILVAVVPLGLDRAWNARHLLARVLAGTATAMAVGATILTYSRGGFLVLVLVIFVMLVWRLFRPSFLVLIAAVALLAGAFLSPAYFARIQTVTAVLAGESAVTDEVSFRGRASEYLVALSLFRDHPFLGVGIGNYEPNYLERSRRIGLDPRREPRQAHNLYLEIAAEQGVVGLLLHLGILALAFGGLERSRRRLQAGGQHDASGMVAAIEVGLAAYLASALLLHDAFPRYYWVWIALAFAMPQATEPLRRPRASTFDSGAST